MGNKKNSRCFNGTFTTITIVLTLIMLHMVLFADYNTFSTLPSPENEKAIACSELKAHEKRLKEDIKKYREERAEKAEYLANLDKKYAELETQYKVLLEQKNMISDKLANINIEIDQ